MIRFSVGTIGPDTQKAQADRKAMVTLDVELTPQSLRLPEVPLGQTIDIKKFKGTSPKITNRGDQTIAFKLTSVPVDASLHDINVEPAPDVSWLWMKSKVIKVKPNRVEEIKVFLRIPDEEKYAGRTFMFLIKAELTSMDLPFEMFSRVIVTTQSKGDKGITP
jgi:hypothetical protein